MALPDNPQSKSTSDEYKASDVNLTAFIFNEIKTNDEKPGQINYIYEQYKLSSRQIWKQAKTRKDYAAIDDRLYADYLNEAYNLSKSDEDKQDLDKHLKTIKDVYKIDYKPLPVKNQFATINLETKTYVVNGVAYDVNDRAVMTSQVSKASLPPTQDVEIKPKTPVEKKKPVITVGPISAPKFLPDPSPFATCVWDTNNPRSVIYGPGCNADGSCLCRGHVICNRGGFQKRRLATCSEKLCTDDTASECSAELGFGSQIPQN